MAGGEKEVKIPETMQSEPGTPPPIDTEKIDREIEEKYGVKPNVGRADPMLRALESASYKALSGILAATADAPTAQTGVQCRPNSLGDFTERLRTFRSITWGNKPLAISPVECAKRGFVNVGMDEIMCTVCSARITYKADPYACDWSSSDEEDSSEPGKTPTPKKNKTPNKGSAAKSDTGSVFPLQPDAAWISAQHCDFCPWRSQVVSCLDVEKPTDYGLVPAFEQRVKSLRQAVFEVPRIMPKNYEGMDLKCIRNPTTGAVDMLALLALFGWSYAVNSRATELRLQCQYCGAYAIVQDYTSGHLGVPTVAADRKAVAGSGRKRRRTINRLSLESNPGLRIAKRMETAREKMRRSTTDPNLSTSNENTLTSEMSSSMATSSEMINSETTGMTDATNMPDLTWTDRKKDFDAVETHRVFCPYGNCSAWKRLERALIGSGQEQKSQSVGDITDILPAETLRSVKTILGSQHSLLM